MRWYVLFTKTGHEKKIEMLLKKQLDLELSSPFIPMLETLFKMSGRIKKEVKPLFPGYIFIESELNDFDFIECIRNHRYYSDDIIRLLRYSNAELAMRESEKLMLLSLCNADHCIESSAGIIVGDKIYISTGPLMGRESIVRKIDRHKRQALIEIDIMGDARQVTVALEIIERI